MAGVLDDILSGNDPLDVSFSFEQEQPSNTQQVPQPSSITQQQLETPSSPPSSTSIKKESEPVAEVVEKTNGFCIFLCRIDMIAGPNAELCKFFLRGNCIKGPQCNFKHVVQTSSSNGSTVLRHNPREKAVVCKHWLRNLCKKGDLCEFLHEYDPNKMPECYFFSKYGTHETSDFCSRM